MKSRETAQPCRSATFQGHRDDTPSFKCTFHMRTDTVTGSIALGRLLRKTQHQTRDYVVLRLCGANPPPQPWFVSRTLTAGRRWARYWTMYVCVVARGTAGEYTVNRGCRMAGPFACCSVAEAGTSRVDRARTLVQRVEPCAGES